MKEASIRVCLRVGAVHALTSSPLATRQGIIEPILVDEDFKNQEVK